MMGNCRLFGADHERVMTILSEGESGIDVQYNNIAHSFSTVILP